MIEEIIWTQGATSDFQAIYNSLSEAKAEDFVTRVEKSLSLLRRFPERAPICRGKIRRLLVGRYNHHGLFYAIEGNRIVVSVIVDLRDDPEKIEALIRSRTNWPDH